MLDGWHEGRRKHAAWYLERMKGLTADEAVLPQEVVPDGRHIYNQFTIRVKGGKRDALQAHLKERGIGSAIYYPICLHEQPCFKDLGYKAGQLPESELAAKEVLSLPVYPDRGHAGRGGRRHPRVLREELADPDSGLHLLCSGGGSHPGFQRLAGAALHAQEVQAHAHHVRDIAPGPAAQDKGHGGDDGISGQIRVVQGQILQGRSPHEAVGVAGPHQGEASADTEVGDADAPEEMALEGERNGEPGPDEDAAGVAPVGVGGHGFDPPRAEIPAWVSEDPGINWIF
jgi:hypothetical protein